MSLIEASCVIYDNFSVMDVKIRHEGIALVFEKSENSINEKILLPPQMRS